MHILQFNIGICFVPFLHINSGYLTGDKASFYAACAAGCFSRRYAMQLYVIHLGCQPFSGL